MDVDEYSMQQMSFRDLGKENCIHYQLSWLREARVNGKDIDAIVIWLTNQDIIIVCRQPIVRECVEAQVTKFVQQNDCKMEFKITLQEPREGTVDALRRVRGLIKSDFIYMSMNSLTTIAPYKILEVYRLYSPTLTTLLYDTRDLDPSGDLRKMEPPNSEYIIINRSDNRLYALTPKHKSKDVFKVRMSLLKKAPNNSLLTTMRGTRIYIFKHWILDFVEKNPGLVSVHYHLVNLLIQAQYRRSVREKYKIDKYIEHQQDCLAFAQSLSTTCDSAVSRDRIFCASVSDPDHITAHIDSEWAYDNVKLLLPKRGSARVRSKQTA